MLSEMGNVTQQCDQLDLPIHADLRENDRKLAAGGGDLYADCFGDVINRVAARHQPGEPRLGRGQAKQGTPAKRLTACAGFTPASAPLLSRNIDGFRLAGLPE